VGGVGRSRGVSKRGRVMSWDFTAEVYLGVEDLPGHVARLLAPYAPFDAIEVSFSATGYDDPGNLTGLPEHCYPPEGDEERTIEAVRVRVGGEPSRPVVKPIFALLERDEGLLAQVDKQELDYTEDEPDGDAIGEAREDRRFDRECRRLDARY